MASTGKNEPCHCGSGKKYEECCMYEDKTRSIKEWLNSNFDDFRFIPADNGLSFLDKDLSEIEGIIKTRNATPIDDFCGLSPDQMTQLLYFPFDSPGLIDFDLNYKDFPDSPLFQLFHMILSTLAKGGLKATTTGNLPRNFCREAALAYYGEEEYKERTRYGDIRTEAEFDELHTTRIIAEITGFIRKVKGKFNLTKKGKSVMENRLDGKGFMELFKAYTWKFNWAYRDRYPEIDIIQRSFLFTLFTLKKYGDIYKPASFYEDIFIKAFPIVLKKIPELPYWKPEEDVRRCYSLRALERFAHFFGFAEFNILEKYFLFKKYELKKTPLLDKWVHFHI